jgi:hypothetical protein
MPANQVAPAPSSLPAAPSSLPAAAQETGAEGDGNPIAFQTELFCMCGACKAEIKSASGPAAAVYCHCQCCRGHRQTAVHHAIVWTTQEFKVVQGEDQLDSYRVVLNGRTTAIVRFVCKSCHDCLYNISISFPGSVCTSAAQYNRNASTAEGGALHAALQPREHFWYSMRMTDSMLHDGLPKFMDMPETFGGTGHLFQAQAPAPAHQQVDGDANVSAAVGVTSQ